MMLPERQHAQLRELKKILLKSEADLETLVPETLANLLLLASTEMVSGTADIFDRQVIEEAARRLKALDKASKVIVE